MPNYSYKNVFTIAYIDMYRYMYIYMHVYGRKRVYYMWVQERILTCKATSLMSKPPAETFLTNASLSFLLLVNKYAASGFSPELIILKLSSRLSTLTNHMEDNVRISGQFFTENKKKVAQYFTIPLKHDTKTETTKK